MDTREPVYLGEPVQNACTMTFDPLDGKIRHFFRKGSWDSGFTSMVYSVEYSGSAVAGGETWTNEAEVVDTGPDTLAQAFLTISPRTKEILLFFYDKQRRTRFLRSSHGRSQWQEAIPFADFSFGGICYGHCIWIDSRVLCGFHGTDGRGAGVYYSDDEGATWRVSNRVPVPNYIPDIWHTGSVEPTFVELRDGRIWMLLRTSNECLYESFSSTRGETWSAPRPSRFAAGPNSWATLKRLSSGHTLLTWNNAMALPPGTTDGAWSFTNRDVIHAAVSTDDGETWLGFRELRLDALRNSSSFVNEPGDKGMNESQLAETHEGKVLVTCGQGAGHRATMLLDPNWLIETSKRDDFTKGLDGWSTQHLVRRDSEYSRLYHHNYNRKNGAVLANHPEGPDRKVLQVKRNPDQSVYDDRDGAVWNFPSGTKGTFTCRVRADACMLGAIIVLTDRWHQPTDSRGEEWGGFQLEILPGGRTREGISLYLLEWNTLEFSWTGASDCRKHGCTVRFTELSRTVELPLRRECANGLSYARFRSTAESEDRSGLLIDWVSVDVHEPAISPFDTPMSSG
jgi:hypothetical protein